MIKLFQTPQIIVNQKFNLCSKYVCQTKGFYIERDKQKL